MKALIVASLALVLTAGCASESTPNSTDQTVVTESSAEATSDVIEIDLTVGESTGASVVHTVPVGSTVRISIVNEDEEAQTYELENNTNKRSADYSSLGA